MKIIAHRGASGEFPENSLLAFEQAIEQGCDGIELDVQYHQASGEFIILHDQYLLFNNQRTHINQLSITELLSNTPKKQGLCTLQQALATIAKQCTINIELKSAVQGQQLRQEIIQLKQLLDNAITNNIVATDQLTLSSFNHHALTCIKELLPKVKTAALIACCPLNYAQFCLPLKVSGLNLAIDCLNQELITDAKQRGLEVWVYTVDNLDDIKQCLAFGVDGIFTNYPERSRSHLLAL